MPARRFSSKVRQQSTRRSSLPAMSATQLNLLLKAIETERDNLSRADSLLGCLEIAMEYGDSPHKGPYYPDVAQIARKMVRKSINALDPINLPGPARDKVREEYCGTASTEPPEMLHHVSLLPQPVLRPLRWSHSLRTHRRNYARLSSRNAASRASASTNSSGCVAR